MTRLYPLFADISGRAVVVIGGGAVAERKAARLLECGARVTVVSPKLTEKLSRWADDGKIKVEQRCYRSGDLEEAWLVIVACGSDDVNRQVRAEADQRQLLCNVVDETDQCSFHTPGVVRRGLLQIAVSTGGQSPALAKHICQELASQYDQAYSELLAVLAELRAHVKRKYPADQARRAEILTEFVAEHSDEVLGLLGNGDRAALARLLDEWHRR